MADVSGHGHGVALPTNWLAALELPAHISILNASPASQRQHGAGKRERLGYSLPRLRSRLFLLDAGLGVEVAISNCQ
jgi:hypothetical protein